MQPGAPNDYTTSVLSHANTYAQLGLTPIPIPYCSKRPAVNGWQHLEQSQGLSLIYQQAQMSPLNIGLRTGLTFLAIDCDRKAGVDGLQHLLLWMGQHGLDAQILLQCPHASTGSGGDHFLFQMPEGVKIPSRQNAFASRPGQKTGIDIRGTGGQIVVAPSVHPETQQFYTWERGPWEVAPPELPPQMLEVLTAPAAGQVDLSARQPKPGDTPTRDQFQDRLGRVSLRRTSRSDMKKAKDALALFEGTAIAVEGGGHDAFVSVTELLGRLWPFADTVAVMEYIRPGIEARLAQGGKTSFWDIERALKGAQAKYAAEASERESGWRGQLDLTDEGGIKATPANILIMLREHEDWRGVFAYNERTTEAVFLRQPPVHSDKKTAPRAVEDEDSMGIVEWFHLTEGMNVQKKHVEDAIDRVCAENSFDPCADWMSGLKWDGKHRLDRWLVDYMGAEDTELNRTFGRKWLLSGVARTLTRKATREDRVYGNGPGCKVDCMLVAIGPQGIGKSTCFSALLPEKAWFTDHLSSISNKDARMELHGPLIVEIGELQALRQVKAQEDSKQFLTTSHDRFRPAYGRKTKVFPRRNIFAGTTNVDDPFRDATGARRFWPFRTERCSPEGIARVRDQLWAEAAHAYLVGEEGWALPRHLVEESERVQKRHYDVPPFVDKLERHLLPSPPAFLPTLQLWRLLLVDNPVDQGRHARQLADSMMYLGFSRERVSVGNDRIRGWKRNDAKPHEIREAALAGFRVARTTPGGQHLN